MAGHTVTAFDAQLEAIQARALEMGGLVEEQVSGAVDALRRGQEAEAMFIIQRDGLVNQQQVEIDEQCSELIARRQPAAVDLRLALAVTKLANDLERVGDEAEKIARMGKLLCEGHLRLDLTRLPAFDKMAGRSMALLSEALNAFARQDAVTARHLYNEDHGIDEDFRSVLRSLVMYMAEDPRIVSASISLLFAAKALERIKDHARNIAGHIVFLVDGDYLRHEGIG